jgi:hypothetical protein
MKSLIQGYEREKRLGTVVIDNRLTDGGEVVSLINRQRLNLVLVSITD